MGFIHWGGGPRPGLRLEWRCRRRPKVEAAAQFARASGRTAVIGSLDQLSHILAGDGGTRISVQAEEMEAR